MGDGDTTPKKEAASRRHFIDANSAFIWISYFYPPFLLCVLYILYINIYGAWLPGLPRVGRACQRGAFVGVCVGGSRASPAPITINFGFCIFL